MEIKTKLTEKDFIRVNLTLLYKRTSVRISLGFFLLYGLLLAISSISNNGSFSFSSVSWILIFLIFLPLMTFVAAKVNYKSNQRIKETIEYKFGKDVLQVKGESFSSEFTWDKIYKVTLTKNWLLIWQTKQIANIIPRRDVWEGDVTSLKEILIDHQVKNNL